MGFLNRYSEPAFALLRIVTGILAKSHPALMSQSGIGGAIELVAALLIASGLFSLDARMRPQVPRP